MKLQDLNRSFGKVLAAVAIAFMISAAPAQAQQGQWGADSCYYTAQGGQWVRQGCMLQLNGNQLYYDIRTSVLTDLRTNSSYLLAQQNGRLLVNAGNGWADVGPAPAGLQAPTSGTAIAGSTWPGSGYQVGGGTAPSSSGNVQVDAITERNADAYNRIWACDPTNYVCPR